MQEISETLKSLYTEYGVACIALEIAQVRHNEIKQKIAVELNKKPIIKDEIPK